MKYMVLMYSDPAKTKAMSAEGREAVRHRHEALHADEAGAMFNRPGLAYPDQTTTIRLSGDRPAATQRPFLEANEQLTA